MKKLLKPFVDLSLEVTKGLGELGDQFKRDFTQLPRTLLLGLFEPAQSQENSPTAQEGGHTPLDIEGLLRHDDQKKRAEIMGTLRQQFTQRTPEKADAETPPPQPKNIMKNEIPLAMGKQNLRGTVLLGGARKNRKTPVSMELKSVEYRGGKLG